MLEYLTPSTLEAMHQDLDKARLSLLGEVNKSNLIEKSDLYTRLTSRISEIDRQYKTSTGKDLRVKMEMARN